MPETIPSTDDARVANSPLRHQYRVLTEAEKATVGRIKDLGEQFLIELRMAGGVGTSDGRMTSRELSIAQTKIEEAVMWAVKHVTK